MMLIRQRKQKDKMVKTIEFTESNAETSIDITITIDNGTLKKTEAKTTDQTGYFEGMLKGKICSEAPEITSRIRASSSCAHTLCSIAAVEDALSIKPTEQTIMLRDLLLNAEILRSNTYNLFFNLLPSANGALAQFSQSRKTDLKKAVYVMNAANKVIKTVGGRDIHPVTAQVGGFTRLPSQEQIDTLRKDLQAAQPDVIATAKTALKIAILPIQSDAETFSLFETENYAVLAGDVISKTKKFKHEEYAQYTENLAKNDKAIRVGPVARMNNSYRNLSKNAKALMAEAKLKCPLNNPSLSIPAQAIEMVHCVDRAIELCRKISIVAEQPIAPVFRKGKGIGAVESPEGLLFHDYEINEKGIITKATIITPAMQNRQAFEKDLKAYASTLTKMKDEKIEEEVRRLMVAYGTSFN